MTILQANGRPFVHAAPAPSATLERELREVLERLDSLLDVAWVPTVFYNQRHDRWEGRYALICRWPRQDSRWGEVQSGKVPEHDAYDIIGWLCSDMQDPQSMPTGEGIVERVLALLGTMDNTRYPWKQRMMNTIGKNAAALKSTKDEMLDMVHDEASYRARAALGIPQSTGANFDKEGRLVK